MLSPEQKAALLALIADEINDRLAEARDAIAQHRMEGDRIGVALPGPDGTPVRIGTISLPKPTTTVTVDEAALLQWAREHMPHEVETVTRVRPATVRALVDQVRRYGGLLDPDTGEVIEVPWATTTQRPTSPRVERPGDRDSEDRRLAWEAVLAAARRGEIHFGLLRPELESNHPGQETRVTPRRKHAHADDSRQHGHGGPDRV